MRHNKSQHNDHEREVDEMGETSEPVELRTCDGLRSLRAIRGVADKRALDLARKYHTWQDLLDAEEQYANECPLRTISYFEPGYPEAFKDIGEAPIEVTIWGDLPKEVGSSIAIIGTREPTDDARSKALSIAQSLAERGRVIVSGMATGIDTSAHEGALSVGGKTVAVVAGTLDGLERDRRTLAQRIVKGGGCVVSREPLFSKPNTSRAPLARNPLVVALATQVLVIQTRGKGGTMKAVGNAIQQGKELYALPVPSGGAEEWNGNALLLDVETAPDLKVLGLPLKSAQNLKPPVAQPWPESPAI